MLMSNSISLGVGFRVFSVTLVEGFNHLDDLTDKL